MAKKKRVENSTEVLNVENGLADATGCGYPNNYPNNNYNMSIIFHNASTQLLSLQWVSLTNTYKANGFCKVVVDLPVDEAFKDGGFEIESNTLSADEINQLKEKMSDEDDIEALKSCLRFGRLYGGSAILVNTDGKTEAPLVVENLQDRDIVFEPVDRWQCRANAKSVQLATRFVLQDSLDTEGASIEYDKSKVFAFTGKLEPYYIRQQLMGWGTSVFEAIIPQLNQYLKSNGVILELLDEAKIDILKIDQLASTLASKGGTSAIRRRLQVASENKNYKSMIAMDTKDDYQQKQLTFSGIDRLLEKIFLLICSSLRMPYGKIFGKGANGFSSGADDLENYYSMIDTEIRVPATKILKKMIDVRCGQLFGRKIDDLTIKWKPLKVLSELEEEQLKKQKIDGCLGLLNAGVLNRKQVAEMLTNDKVINLSDEEIEQIEENDTFEEETEIEEKKSSVQGDLKRAKNSLWDNLRKRV